MSKLTDADRALITTFFAGARSPLMGDGLAAQSYEPKGKGYDPSTDTRLAGLVLHGIRPGKSAWAHASLVVDQLCGRPGGGAHLDVLRRACESRADVGAHVPRAMAYGHERAKEAARLSELESEYRECRRQGLSSFETTARILAFDAKLKIEVSLCAVLDHARHAVAARLITVDAEIDALIDAAADALHAARDRVRATEAARTAVREQRGADLRAELAGKRKETASTQKAKRAAAALAACVRLRAAS